jgi:hypothetical protein
MDLTPYVQRLRNELAVAAEAGGEDARLLAERLTAPLDATTRLTLLNVLSAAAGEITRDLAPGSVEVRLRGGDPSFVVTPPPAEPEPAEPGAADTGNAGEGFAGSLTRMGEAAMGGEPPVGQPDADEGGTSRINFRPPQQLKARIEEAAAREGLSVNAWLIRATAAAVEGPRGPQPGARPGRRAARSGQRYTGWVR